jgi:predicted enzyme related to lactoylglutathione lyase
MDQQGGATDSPGPIVELAAITVDCLDLRPVIDFYAQAFGARTSHENDTGAWIRLDQGPLILLRRVDGYQAPTWPQQDVPIQFQLELWIDDLDEAESRLPALGAATPRPHRDSGRRSGCFAHRDGADGSAVGDGNRGAFPDLTPVLVPL